MKTLQYAHLVKIKEYQLTKMAVHKKGTPNCQEMSCLQKRFPDLYSSKTIKTNECCKNLANISNLYTNILCPLKKQERFFLKVSILDSERKSINNNNNNYTSNNNNNDDKNIVQLSNYQNKIRNMENISLNGNAYTE